MPIERDLRAKRFFVTGATGFLGTALVERILRCVPEAEITVLIRPGRRADAAARLAREVIKNDCFDRLRAEWGDQFAERVAHRVQAVAGDVGQDGLGLDEDGRAALAAAGVVIHSAATVSFDAPLTQAVEINLLGPSRVAAAMADVAEQRGSPAHMIAVSTAYVASTHQGNASEELLSENRFTLDVAWRDEVTAARRVRADLEAESRRPDRLQQFTKKARTEVGAAGDHLIATRAERFRDEWVSDELVKAGTARALSLGWPDAYPFTKALGERALVEQWAATVPITVVRPSIIESALTEPRPGWIRGFRMAEPIIISYARGLLREFPGVPEGIVDVIPVDMVVAAILAVAARGPEPGAPKVYHVASGVRNPLRYGRLVELGEEFFGRNPLYDERGQPINVPDWSFPGRGRVQRQLKRADAAMTVAERMLTALPIRGKQAQLAAQIEDRHAMAKRALGYVTLYGAYTETDARYRVDNLLELWGSATSTTRRTSGSIPASSTGTTTSTTFTSHPSSSTPACARSRGSRSWRSGRSGSGGPSCRPIGISPSSTWSTRSWLRTSSTPTPGWPAATSPPPGGHASWPTSPAEAPDCSPLTVGTGATFFGRSTCASRAPRWRNCRRILGSSSTASSCRGPSPTGSLVCGRTVPWGTAPC